ncbi:alpha/beta fold hydrolase [Brevibacillus parabrevis]|jgi:Predicted acetyltransferases and hydrolases with the alpha/beta hydrolase fold|uniref:alpha/beta fold hydrolase n=1 Tax=Brevibacillus parabrevis TaxID=54914 RepID=UPI0024911188|nr:alpha/beta fold hydrolase [Brevibacillus parabrevis]
MGINKAELFSKTDRKRKYAVIFVHGLFGDPVETWRKDTNSKTLPELVCLDKELSEVDVYSFGYRSNFKLFQYDFNEISNILYSEIQAKVTGKEIIFIAHSMGGLVVQQYIVGRYDHYDTAEVERIKGIVYLSVPFEGSAAANFFAKFLPFHKQIKTLIENSPSLTQLREQWVKYIFRGGHENLPEDMRIKLNQIALYGVRDMVVTKKSASPFHIGAKVMEVEEDHKSICKVDQFSTVYLHLKKFISEVIALKTNLSPMVVHVHGWDKQGFQEEPHYSLDWTKHFHISASSRCLPSLDIWEKEIQPEIDFVSKEWSEKWVRQGGVIRIYAKLCLTGALLLGSKLSVTKGVKVEVEHYGQIWAADNVDPTYKARPMYTLGNPVENQRAVLILSVTKDIQNEVMQYLSDTKVNYKKMVNLFPMNGPGHNSIENNKQALSFAISVKNEVEQLKNEGIKELYLFLNAPLSVALFVGHRLTASCPIQTFEFNGTGYVLSCRV